MIDNSDWLQLAARTDHRHWLASPLADVVLCCASMLTAQYAANAGRLVQTSVSDALSFEMNGAGFACLLRVIIISCNGSVGVRRRAVMSMAETKRPFAALALVLLLLLNFGKSLSPAIQLH